MTNTDYTGQWVSVVFVQDNEYYDIADMGPDEMVAYLAQGDYGQEEDDAHTYDSAPWGTYDRLYHVTLGGIDYVLSIGDIYAGLNRRPLA